MSKATVAVVGLIAAAMLLAFGLPYIADNTQDTQTRTILQDENVEYILNGDVNTTATNIGASSANITLISPSDRNQTQLNEGQTKTVEIENDQIDITLEDADNPNNQASVTYSYAPFAGFPQIVSDIGTNIPLMLIALGILCVAAILLEVTR